jgi:hypothetical protein
MRALLRELWRLHACGCRGGADPSWLHQGRQVSIALATCGKVHLRTYMELLSGCFERLHFFSSADRWESLSAPISAHVFARSEMQ